MRNFCIAILLGFSASGHAITWCHDYAIYRASKFVLGNGYDSNNLGPGELKSRLSCLGYTLAILAKPGDLPKLEVGDVILIGNAAEGQPEDHSGFVTGDTGQIDHMIQMYGDTKKPYTPSQVETIFDPHFGENLVRKNWTMSDLRNRKRKSKGIEIDSVYKNKTFQVFRRTRQLQDQIYAWISSDVTRANPNAKTKGLFAVDFVKGEAVDETAKITFSRLPKLILEGEEVGISAEMYLPTALEYTEQRFQMYITGNLVKPRAIHGGIFANPLTFSLEISLCDPAKSLVSFKTPDGKSIKDAPPAKGEVRFPWPKPNPESFVEYRDVITSFPGGAQYRERYTRQPMMLKEVLHRKYPEMIAK